MLVSWVSLQMEGRNPIFSTLCLLPVVVENVFRVYIAWYKHDRVLGEFKENVHECQLCLNTPTQTCLLANQSARSILVILLKNLYASRNDIIFVC